MKNVPFYFLQLDLSAHTKIELEKVVDSLNQHRRNFWSEFRDEAVEQKIVFAVKYLDYRFDTFLMIENL